MKSCAKYVKKNNFSQGNYSERCQICAVKVQDGKQAQWLVSAPYDGKLLEPECGIW